MTLCKNGLHEMTPDNEYLMTRSQVGTKVVRCLACYERSTSAARARKAEARRVRREAEAAADAWRASERKHQREQELNRLRDMVARDAAAQRARNAARDRVAS